MNDVFSREKINSKEDVLLDEDDSVPAERVGDLWGDRGITWICVVV